MTHVPYYAIEGAENLLSPSLVFVRERIEHNIRELIRIAGSPARLRPHAKTHKCAEIVRMEVGMGITSHKCATIAEAEMIAGAGGTDILLAYPLVGPNIARMRKLMQAYPQVRFSALADHPENVEDIAREMVSHGQTLGLVVDLDVGMRRTGIPAGERATAVYRTFAEHKGVEPYGFHVYDGHNTALPHEERLRTVRDLLEPVLKMRETLQREGIPVDRLVCGGTPTFPIFAAMTEIAGVECAAGTLVLHDEGYPSRYPELRNFQYAAMVLTRVISKPWGGRVTTDLGYKAVASDPPAGKRLIFPELHDYQFVLQSEEHLGFEVAYADDIPVGLMLQAIPMHVCPTVAMHRRAAVVENGRIVDSWDIVARDRMLTI